jgi:hypothetical protein
VEELFELAPNPFTGDIALRELIQIHKDCVGDAEIVLGLRITN